MPERARLRILLPHTAGAAWIHGRLWGGCESSLEGFVGLKAKSALLHLSLAHSGVQACNVQFACACGARPPAVQVWDSSQFPRSDALIRQSSTTAADAVFQDFVRPSAWQSCYFRRAVGVFATVVDGGLAAPSCRAPTFEFESRQPACSVLQLSQAHRRIILKVSFDLLLLQARERVRCQHNQRGAPGTGKVDFDGLAR